MGRRNIRPRETARAYSSDQEWNIRANLDRQLHFLVEITATTLPDIVV